MKNEVEVNIQDIILFINRGKARFGKRNLHCWKKRSDDLGIKVEF